MQRKFLVRIGLQLILIGRQRDFQVRFLGNEGRRVVVPGYFEPVESGLGMMIVIDFQVGKIERRSTRDINGIERIGRHVFIGIPGFTIIIGEGAE